MRIPLLGGMSAQGAEFVESPPLNLEPVALDSKLSQGQYRAPAGIVPYAMGPGQDRGGYNWNGRHIRVMGDALVELSGGNVVTLRTVGLGSVSFAEGFDRLAVRVGPRLFYLQGNTATEVTDIDLGAVLDCVWVDGYFMTTDGTFLVVTELNNPLEVEPLKYGSAEEDPDALTGLIKVRGEVYALGRFTIEVLSNVGGLGFPFQVVDGATIPYGCVSAGAKCAFAGSFAFAGSARDEALGVYIAGNGTATKISTRALDRALAKEADPTAITMESRVYLNETRLLVHLSTGSWVYCASASARFQLDAWYVTDGPRNAVLLGSEIYVGDGARIGRLSNDVATRFEQAVEWRFETGVLANEGLGYIITGLELVGLPGRAMFGDKAFIALSWSFDGETWSSERVLPLKGFGARRQRMAWRPRIRVPSYAMLRFRGYDAALPGFSSLEAQLEPLTA